MNNTKQISELFDYQPKSGRKAGDGLGEGLFPFYTSGQTQSKYLNVHDFEGDSLVLGTGGKPSVHFATGKFSATNDCFVIKPKNEDEIHPKYLYYYFLNKMYLLENGFRGAGLKHLSRSYFNDLPIPIFDYHTSQLRIIDILDKANVLRQKRKESIKLLDEFLRSTFLEMFGDPFLNPYSLKTRCLGDVAIKFSDGPFGSNLKTSHYRPEGVRVVRLQNIGVGEFIGMDKVFVSEEHFQSIIKHECLPGDIIIGTLGDPNLRACILPNNIEKAINKADCVQLRPNYKKTKSEYLVSLLNQPGTLALAYRLLHGQTRTRISMGTLRELEVPIGDLTQQNKFADIVQQVEKLKAEYKESEKELDNLFGSLMQRAFKGEL